MLREPAIRPAPESPCPEPTMASKPPPPTTAPFSTAPFAAAPSTAAPSTAAVEQAFAEFQQAMSRGQAHLQTVMETASEEGRRFFEGMTEDAAAALQEFKTCQSAAHALTIEQAWLARRAQAYLDCGLRLIHAMTPARPPVDSPGPAAPSDAA